MASRVSSEALLVPKQSSSGVAVRTNMKPLSNLRMKNNTNHVQPIIDKVLRAKIIGFPARTVVVLHRVGKGVKTPYQLVVIQWGCIKQFRDQTRTPIDYGRQYTTAIGDQDR